MKDQSTVAIKLENITKVYPNGILANSDINFTLKYGEIHAIFGENGAGKTTLIKILLGEIPVTSGKIFINNIFIKDHNPKISQNFDIAVIHQHFSLIDNFTIFENAILGYEIKNAQKIATIKQEYDQFLAKIEAWYKNQDKNISIQKEYEKALTKLNSWKAKQMTSFFCYNSGLQKELITIIEKFNLNLNICDSKFSLRFKDFFAKFWQKPSAIHSNKKYVEELSVNKKQKLEILKILFRNAKIIIFDEPTSVITANEIDAFLKSLLIYKKAGKAVVFISHKLKEIRKIADTITVLKAGKVVGNFTNNKKVTDKELIKLMIGNISLFSIKNLVRMPVSATNLLELKAVNLIQNQQKILDNVNLNLKKGEIVGLVGMENNGQKELLEIIACMQNCSSGSIFYKNNLFLAKKSPIFAREQGISYVPQDRTKVGLISNESLFFNTFFNNWKETSFFKNGLIKKKNICQRTQKIIEKYRVLGAVSDNQVANTLSGGNQQKFIIGRELMTNPQLLLIHEPTWGIDVGTINLLHKIMIDFRNQGNTILFASVELEETIKIADRILVMSRGQIQGELKTTNKKDVLTKIGQLMAN